MARRVYVAKIVGVLTETDVALPPLPRPGTPLLVGEGLAAKVGDLCSTA